MKVEGWRERGMKEESGGEVYLQGWLSDGELDGPPSGIHSSPCLI